MTTVPLGKPLRTMSLRNISSRCSFSTRTAPTSPKSAGTSHSASYFTSSPSWLVLFAYPFTVGFSDPVLGSSSALTSSRRRDLPKRSVRLSRPCSMFTRFDRNPPTVLLIVTTALTLIDLAVVIPDKDKALMLPGLL
uniref:Linoleate 13S-lipoxygenase 2-1ic-like n=1 Tax=Rhizophora mucronata TaxID=61149 RepID=A0A2P2J6U0_RHIMU